MERSRFILARWVVATTHLAQVATDRSGVRNYPALIPEAPVNVCA